MKCKIRNYTLTYQEEDDKTITFLKQVSLNSPTIVFDEDIYLDQESVDTFSSLLNSFLQTILNEKTLNEMEFRVNTLLSSIDVTGYGKEGVAVLRKDPYFEEY